MVALAGPLGAHQRGEQAGHAEQRATGQIGHRDPGHGRPAADSDDAERAGAREEVDVVARLQRRGPVGSVAGDRAVHDRGVDGAQRVVADTQPIHHPRPVALDRDMGVAGQRPRHLRAPWIAQVQDDRALVAIDHPAERR